MSKSSKLLHSIIIVLNKEPLVDYIKSFRDKHTIWENYTDDQIISSHLIDVLYQYGLENIYHDIKILPIMIRDLTTYLFTSIDTHITLLPSQECIEVEISSVGSAIYIKLKHYKDWHVIQ